MKFIKFGGARTGGARELIPGWGIEFFIPPPPPHRELKNLKNVIRGPGIKIINFIKFVNSREAAGGWVD